MRIKPSGLCTGNRLVPDSDVVYLALAVLFSRLLLWQRPDRDRPARGCVHINGAWLARGTRNESRYAAEMVKAIAAMGTWDLVVHVPAGVTPRLPQWLDCPRIEVRRARVAGDRKSVV